MISPPELKKLINVLSERNEKPTVVLTLDYSVRRSEGRYETASGSIERPLDASEVQSLKGALYPPPISLLIIIFRTYAR